MKLITYSTGGQPTIGALIPGQKIVPLDSIAPDMITFIEQGEVAIDLAKQAIENPGSELNLQDVKLFAPIPKPNRNIMCLGKNYADHAHESNRAWGDKLDLPQYPVIFTKSVYAVNGPYDDIPYDPNVSAAIDFEAELLLVIGRPGKNISRERALDHIFGYSVINDLSARDLQRQHNQFFKGKSLDGHAPFGPWIVTRSDIADPHNLKVTCEVNGVEKQNGNTNQMIFDIPETIFQLSKGMQLYPGDLIATGTPSGVGFARNPPEFLKPGDIVTCSVEGIGTIKNQIGLV